MRKNSPSMAHQQAMPNMCGQGAADDSVLKVQAPSFKRPAAVDGSSGDLLFVILMTTRRPVRIDSFIA
jgi:hypothetical protein